jgi:hypothetical protein
LKPPLRVDDECFLITTVQVGPILRPKFGAASLPSISEAQRKKQNCGGMGVDNNRFLNTIPRGKFGLSAGIQTENPPSSCFIENFMQNFNDGKNYYIQLFQLFVKN